MSLKSLFMTIMIGLMGLSLSGCIDEPYLYGNDYAGYNDFVYYGSQDRGNHDHHSFWRGSSHHGHRGMHR